MPFNVSIIGYVRIVLSLTSFALMPFQPTAAATCYMLNIILDEFDGKAARKFNQGRQAAPLPVHYDMNTNNLVSNLG